MNNPSSAPAPDPATPAIPLPVLHNGLLDDGQLRRLLDDIEACARIIEIIPKRALREHVPGARLSLAQAREHLANRTLCGLQIRYEFEGAEWWDTLLLASGGCRIVRLRQDFHNPGA
jgi:hypothetical protein